MRILFVIRSLDLGGAERQCCSLAVSLREHGHDVRVVTLGSGGVLASELVRHGVELNSLGHRGPRDLLRSAYRLRSFVKGLSPEVIYSFMSVSNILCAVCLPDPPRSCLVWGLLASGVDHPGYGWFTRFVLRIERRLAQRPRLIISNSLAGADYHIEHGYPRDRTLVVENAIDSSAFDFNVSMRTAVRNRMGIAEGRKIVVIVARIDLIKGYDTFLAAAAQIAVRHENVDFWCIGGGDTRLTANLKERARALAIESRVLWHGEVRQTSDSSSFSRAADLAISASMAEGFPNSVAECLACGLRVVGTDAGDTRRIIGNSGECVPIGDAAAMASAILRQLDRDVAREVDAR